MDPRQVEGIDVYGFPTDLLRHALLAWKGDDYVQFIAVELSKRFQKQDPGTEMLALKCEDRPRILTSVDERTGTVQGVIADFNLQVLLQASDGKFWRLHGEGKLSVVGLDQPEHSSASVGFDVHSAEEAE